MSNIHFGQNYDIFWHNDVQSIPTEEMYFQMVVNKTSVLPRMCVRIISVLLEDGAVSPDQMKNMIYFIEALGSAF